MGNLKEAFATGLGAVRWGVAPGALAVALMFAPNVAAQTAPVTTPTQAADRQANSSGDADPNKDIVVTGSRAIVNGAAAPTPVTVVSSEQLQAAAPSSIIDGLNQLPVFQASNTPAANGSSGSGTFGNGGNFLNLRALTPERTLVLLDGRRTVSGNLSLNATDVNLFPQLLISRVDVVTGGASAAYGSDAVAGVVNFVVDTKFTGVKAILQNGISDLGDGHTFRVGVAVGKSFADDRGHFLASFDHSENDAIDDPNTRPWAATGYGLIPSNTGTSSIFAPDVRLTGATFGGTINSCLPAGARCPIANMSFNPDGTLSPFVNGTQISSAAQSGGSGAANRTNLEPAIRTNTAYARASYTFSPAFQVFAEGIYGDTNNDYLGAPNFPTYGSSAITIFSDNAYLPPALRSTLAANGITSFKMGRANADIAPNRVHTNTKTYRSVVGATGTVAGWTYNLGYERSTARYQAYSRNNIILQNFYNAADAVVNPATNSIVCRSTLLGLPQGAGCVPINLFGDGSPSAAATNYTAGTSYADLHTRQDDLAFDVRGSPFSTWADKVSLAVGVEYRHEQAQQFTDAISSSIKSGAGIRGFPTSLNAVPGGYALSNPQPIKGSFSVKEVFLETSVPLARDWKFAHSLDVNGAIRYADYSNVGGVTTWKAGAVYEPIQGIRLRGTRSRDIRAAGIPELFTSSQQTAGLSARDTTLPGAPLVAPITRQTRGNVGLTPEKADTTTAGIVLEPTRRINFSVDYYHIAIKDAITQATLQQVIDGCAVGAASLCSLITRDATTNAITTVVAPYLNLASIRTSGLDIEAGYRTELGGTSLALRAIVNHTFELKTTNSGITVDRAGDLGQLNAAARWSGTASINAARGGFNVYVQERFVSAGQYDSTAGPTVLPIAQNHIPSRFYTDLTVKYRIGPPESNLELFGTVNNLFDRDPPLVPIGATTLPRQTNPYFYDVLGRFVTVGARVRF